MIDSTLSIWETTLCLIDENEDIQCFLAHGDNYGVVEDTPTEDHYHSISVGYQWACGIKSINKKLTCWGREYSNTINHYPQEDVFNSISLGSYFGCGIYADTHKLRCWGYNNYQQASAYPTEETFVMVASGSEHACAIDTVDVIHCWGRNDRNQVTIFETTYFNLEVWKIGANFIKIV